jgi:magnesium-transporting ATPase (P-type)
MKHKYFSILFLFFLLVSFSINFLSVYAQGYGPGGSGSVTIDDPLQGCGAAAGQSPLAKCVSKVAGALFYLAIPLCTVMILVGGYQILVAGGDPAKFKTGRQTILYAVIGFVVVLLASSVPYIIDSIFH